MKDIQWKEFPAKKNAYSEMLSYVTGIAEQAGMSAKQQMKFQLGFEEASINIISYAYDADQDGKIWISAYKEQDRFILELKDSGVPFNPLNKEDALENRPSSLEEAKIGGLGIAFMRRVFSEISYHYGKENDILCNHLKLAMDLTKEIKLSND